MSEKETIEVDQFQATDDHGREFMITVYQDFIINQTHNGNSTRIPSLKRAFTAEGYHVNYKSEDTFEIVELGILVKKM